MQRFVDENMKYLWSLAFNDDRVEVRSSALQQLAKFEWTSHSLKVMPEYCKQGLKLPPGVDPKQDDGTDLKPEDVLEYVPGEVWIELLEGTHKKSDQALNAFVSSILVKEVNHLPKSVFSLSQSMKNRGQEPPRSSNKRNYVLFAFLGKTSMICSKGKSNGPSLRRILFCFGAKNPHLGAGPLNFVLS